MNSRSPLLFALALSLAACGGDATGGGDPEAAYLTIDGDANIFIEPGTDHGLSVTYHDGQGTPLVGEISFEIVGDSRGSTIDKDFGATNAEGEASLRVLASQQEAVFHVKATAPYATAVEWTISVSETVTREMDIRGSYDIDSDFDLVGVLPGTAGSVIDTITDMSDDPNDPASYILDKILEGQSGTVANAANALRPGLDAILNDAITTNAPGFVNDLLDLGNDLDQIAHRFGLTSEMSISGDTIESNTVNATHAINGMSFELNSATHVYSMEELGADSASVDNISVARDLDTDRLEISQHSLPIPYGELLAVAIEDIIVPAIDPSSTSLAELLSAKINCGNIAEALADNVGLFGESFYDSACELGVEAAANAILDKLREIDDGGDVNLLITGTTIMKDPNNDERADSMDKGQWNGFVDYKGELSELHENMNPFTGARSN